MTYWRKHVTNWDQTEELPAIVRDYCKKCGWHSWGPASTHFVCMECTRHATKQA